MEVKDTNSLVEKWGSEELGKLSVASIEDSYIKEGMSVLLENQDKVEAMNEAAFLNDRGGAQIAQGNQGNFEPIAMALQRRTFPELFAHKIVGVQALSTPVGLAYAMRIMYEDGTEAGFEQVPTYSGYTGSDQGVVTSATVADAGTAQFTTVSAYGNSGTDAGAAESWAIGATGTEKYPGLKMDVVSQSVVAKSRKLAASFSLEIAQDLQAVHGIEIQREMVSALQYEVQAEMDRELLQSCKTAAVNTGTGPMGAIGGEAAVTATLEVSGNNYGRWNQEKYNSVVNKIVYTANRIATSTRRGAGNFVVVSPRVATALQAAGNQFVANKSANLASVGATNALVEVGTINGGITVYRDSYAPQGAGEDYALVGYKGPGISDTGVIFSPYIMNLMSQATDGNTFAPRVGVMSRYAISNNLLGAGRYYRMINFSDLSSLI